MSRKPVEKRSRVAILDDHPMTRDGIKRWIAGEPDLEVCWEAASAEEALAATLRDQPDLVVADISLLGRSGLEFIKDVRAVVPSLFVLVLSMHDEVIYAERALRAGARGYIMKHEGGAKLLTAIRAILAGKIHVSDQISGHILETYSSPTVHTGVSGLSDRELEVFELLGAGLSTPKIAKRLSVSPKTVDSHRANIKAKLRLTKMSELVAYAARWSGGGTMTRE